MTSIRFFGHLLGGLTDQGIRMAKETTVSNFKLKGREILSSYANFTLEGEITAKVERGKESWTITERNGIPKGTSDGENEAVYIPNDQGDRVDRQEHRQACCRRRS